MQLFECGIGLLSDQLPELLQVLRPEYGRVPTAMGPGFQRAGTTVQLQQPSDEGDADQEPAGDLAQGPITTLDRLENPLAEILRVGFHGSPPHKDLPSNGAPSNCSAL